VPRLVWKQRPRRAVVLKRLRTALPELRDDFPLSFLAVFGSVAHDKARAESDIDILVSFKPEAKISLHTLARLRLRLEDLLQHSVDLVERGSLHPAVKDHVEEEMIIVWDGTHASSSGK